MDISNLKNSVKNYIKGFLELRRIKTPRYSFLIDSLDIIYHQDVPKTKINYLPVGCHRPFRNFATELNEELVCRKFKPHHARVIIAISTLEQTLNFQDKEQLLIYLDYVKTCIDLIRTR